MPRVSLPAFDLSRCGEEIRSEYEICERCDEHMLDCECDEDED